MKRNIFYAVLFISLFCSCRKDEAISFGDSGKSTVKALTCNSFTLEGTYAVNTDIPVDAKVGFLLDTESGITFEKNDTIVGLTDVSSAKGSHSHDFDNFDSVKERVYPIGTTVYCRSFLKRADKIILGDEISFTIPKSEYTVMVYGVGGGNLDGDIAEKTLIPMMLSGGNGKMEMTFQFKMSSKYQEYEEIKMKGVHRWVIPEEGEFAKIWDSSAVKYDDKDERPYVTYAYNKIAQYSKQIGDDQMSMSEPQSLSSFIDWSMQKCPAEKYILVMIDHGNGWDFYTDGSSCIETKAQLDDDNLKNKNTTSIIDFIAGVKGSSVGRLSAVVLAECLMANIENIAEISTVSDCAMAMNEIAYGMKGEFFMDDIKKGIDSGKDAFSFLSDYSDHYTAFYDQKGYYTDCGIYDLKKIDNLFSVLKQCTAFLCDMYSTHAEWKGIIGLGATEAVCSRYLENQESRKFVLIIKKQVENWDSLQDYEKDMVITDIESYNKFHYSYCLYDFLQQTAIEGEKLRDMELYENYNSDLDKMVGFVSAYDKALKDMSHITCTQAQSKDTPYQYTSLSVTLQSLHEDYYKPISKSNLYGYAHYYDVPYENAISIYQALEFDKKTSWSSLLKQLMVSATFFFNGDRQIRQTGK